MNGPRKTASIRPILALLALLVVFPLAFGAYLYLKTLRDNAVREEHNRVELRTLSIAEQVEDRLMDYQKVARALAGLPALISALERATLGARTDVNAVLDRFQSELAVEVCYLMDHTGTTIASSNRDQPDSFVGKNYAFRPYFRNAIEGWAAPYLALGVTSGRRGVYFSSAVRRGEADKPLGVAVIKAPIEPITRSLSTTLEELVFLVDPNGVIFDSNRSERLFQLLGEVSAEQAAKIAATKQFGNGPWPSAGFRSQGQDVLIDAADRRYRSHEASILMLSGWKVVILLDLERLKSVAATRYLRPAVVMVLILCLLLAMVVLLYRRGSGEIRQRRQYEGALRLSEARHRQIFENTGTATVIIEPDTTISLANSEFERLSGYSKEEIEGRIKWPTFIDEQDVERLKTYHAERRQEGGEAPTEYEFRFRDRHGRLKNVIARVNMLPGTQQSIAALTDVTPLRQAESLFRELFLHAELGLYILQQGRFRMVNPQFEKLTGYSQAEFEDRPAMDLVYPEDREHVKRNAARMLKGELAEPYEFRGVRKDGSVRWLMETATPILYRGQPAVLGNFMDITARKKMENEVSRAQRLESIGFLAAGIAHDFNNLLTVILGNIDLAEMQSTKGSPILGNLEDARKATLKARDLARQLVTFARGGAPAKQKGSVLDCARRAVAQKTQGTRAALEISAPEDLWPVEFDPPQLEQVLDILVTNALEAMKGEGRLELSLANVQVREKERDQGLPLEPGRYVRVTVRDEGPGIPAENQGRLFDPYFSTKERGSLKGMGLGLSTALSIVRRHGGHLQIESLAGVGTTVFFHLPALAEAA